MNYYVVIAIFYNPLTLTFITIVFIKYVVVELGVMGMKTTKSMGFPKSKQEQGQA
jgi:integral membrane sensor domain MASE1